MDDNEKDGAAVRIPPPLVFLGGVIVGVVVHAFVTPLPIGLSAGLRIAIGVTAVVPGLVLMAGAIGLFRRTGQDPKPWKSTPEIVSTGVYRITRNPMYVGMALLQIAIGVGLANWWVIILVPVALSIVHTTAVRHEEVYLERKFEDEFTRYKASVRRWL
ncbi:MAG: isoprenylcysteine carboxylmethyltransferase family protein [Gammaproteobacteria bacterium]|nr:MAG: isoprenylcysteine carboxylmethyltransferase family protein [Gammaproteobacteria bacterium]